MEITKAIREIYANKDMYLKMKQVAIDKGISEFSYFKIAKKAISE